MLKQLLGKLLFRAEVIRDEATDEVVEIRAIPRWRWVPDPRVTATVEDGRARIHSAH